MTQPLPSAPDLSFEKKQAKALLHAARDGDAAALARMREPSPRLRTTRPEDLTLADAQFAVARERGFESWTALKAHIDAQQPLGAQIQRFFTAIREQQLAVARRVLKEHPAIVEHSLHAAAAAADTDRVAEAIARDPSQVNAPDADNNAVPILYACGSTFHTLGPQVAAASLRTVELLLDHGADPNASRLSAEEDATSKLSALYFACVSNNVPVVELLLERGAAVNDGESVYHSAELNHRECLELLRAHGEDLSGRHPRWSNSPLYFLVGHHDDKQGTAPWFLGVQWLLEHGADPNVTSYAIEEAPLHKVAATVTHSVAVADLFIAHGANVNLPRADGRTPYVIALRHGNAAVVDRLVANGAHTEGATPIDALLGACMRADAPAARALVAAHPGLVASLAPEDKQMFAQAVWTGRLESVRLMAEIGFDLTWEGAWGGTPLHHAAWLGQPAIVRLLLDLGAPVNVRDAQFGSSPIAWAAHGSSNFRSADDDYCAIVDTLIDAGSDYATSINKHSEPPESMASRRVAKRLRERGFIPKETP